MPIEGSSNDHYVFLDKIGDGAFGQVFRARDKITRQIVAIKTVKHKSLKVEDTTDYSLREYRSLSQLDQHPNIVQLYKTFVASDDELHLVMEYVNGGNLYQLIHQRSIPFDHSDIRRIFRQILQALEHIHSQGIFHRDLKPENILVSYLPSGESIIKLADFGLARPIGSKGPYTDYICTRWYRAPEILLRARKYSYPVDLWAAGTLFAELITLNPLFPGNTEVDQLYRICAVLGSPGKSSAILTRRTTTLTKQQQPGKPSPGFARRRSSAAAASPISMSPLSASSFPLSQSPPSDMMSFSAPSAASPLQQNQKNDNEWREGAKMANRMGFSFPQIPGTPLENVLPTASPSMIDLIRKFLYYDPQRRIQASEALQHPFFHEDKRRPRDEELLLRKDNTKRLRMEEIEAIDLLTTPNVPLQVCPDWDMFHHHSHHHHPHHHPHQYHNNKTHHNSSPYTTTGTTTTTTTTITPITTRSTTSTALIPFQQHLDTVIHYGKQLTTWQQQQQQQQQSNHKPYFNNNHHKRSSETLYSNHSSINSISSPFPTLTTTTTAVTPTHALAESASTSTEESDYNRLSGWPWLKVL
ncbi:kinase-like domain-containing protein [Phascolomyces articulosus]|uniref:Kinase-like domain-containing protein n=1 Tax=Phascolomyces articulosus TaxID=60185 RepID=A0AAD5JQN5_9FUNG|nr:kinase-like domain-containing protein [Phascolomyces articulosus]